MLGLRDYNVELMINSGTVLESSTIEGESPVYEIMNHPSSIPSRTGHVKPCLNLGGPPSKAKYYLMTDSEPVPRGKGEKYPC